MSAHHFAGMTGMATSRFTALVSIRDRQWFAGEWQVLGITEEGSLLDAAVQPVHRTDGQLLASWAEVAEHVALDLTDGRASHRRVEGWLVSAIPDPFTLPPSVTIRVLVPPA